MGAFGLPHTRIKMSQGAPKREAEDHIVNSIIGEGSEFRGEFKINGLLRVDGKFTGTIQTEGKVLIGQSGEAVTDIEARIVIIGGTVRGNICATERVILLSTGYVTGNIITPGIVMEEGSTFDGQCVINKRADKVKAS
jgi:cytoskeletal protein CcmA (bactofilin family)